jgi:hypothetical protein
MIASVDWPSILAKTGIREAVEAQGRQARGEIHYAYRALDFLGTEAAILGHSLRAEGNLALATPIALVATVIRQQVEMATGTEWFPECPGGTGGSNGTWGIGEGDLSLEDLRSLPGLEAAEALVEELQSLALLLANASDCVPQPWTCNLSRCVGSLFLVLAQLQEVAETAGTKRKREALPNLEPIQGRVRVS